MRLNNKGWGTVEMLLLSGGLLIALLVAVFFIYKLYSSLDNSYANVNYQNNEAIRYIDDKIILID